ncbi:hypothetical protein ACFWV1_31375 [Streptomyces sp. NPDC058700]|uniref:hypothetical protein n=1 Tax=unclassified Streptomyces TaxID=2593676 RepID=UPI00365C9F54
MKPITIEEGLYVQDGSAYGVLADATLRRTAETRRRLDRLQEEADTMTYGELFHGTYRALKHYTQNEVNANQVSHLVEQIRRGARLEWNVPERLSCV